MSKKFINILILICLVLVLIIIYFFPVNCIFKQFTGISCPGCGLTRAFYALLSFNFIDAFFLNILSIPLFIFIIFLAFNLLLDIIKNRFSFIPKLFNFLAKYYIFIIFLILLSFIYNNVYQ